MNSLYIAAVMVKRMLGSRKSVLFTLVIPVAVVSLIVALFGRDSSAYVAFSYVNEDRGAAGSHIIRELEAKSVYRLKASSDVEDMKERIVNHQADAAILIPADFTERMLSGKAVPVNLLHQADNEGTVSLRLTLDQSVSALSEAAAALRSGGGNAEEQAQAFAKLIEEREKHRISTRVTPALPRSAPGLYLIVGFILMFQMTSISRAVGIILEDRRQLTMARIYSAPVTPLQITVGNFLGGFLFGSLQTLTLTVFTMYVVRFDYGIGFLALFSVLECFMLASMGLVSLLASLVKNETNLGALNSLVITPTCMLGGCYWPIEMMPDFMQKLANFVPQKWAIDALKRLAGGETVSDVGLQVGILLLFGAVLLAFGSVILKPAEAAEG